MATYKLEESELSKLKGKTIIITGGSSGIGKSTVEIAHSMHISIERSLHRRVLQSVGVVSRELCSSRKKPG